MAEAVQFHEPLQGPELGLTIKLNLTNSTENLRNLVIKWFRNYNSVLTKFSVYEKFSVRIADPVKGT